MNKRNQKKLMDKLWSAAFDIGSAGNQLNYLANDIRKGVANYSPDLLKYIEEICIPMLRLVWKKEAVDEVVKLIEEAKK